MKLTLTECENNLQKLIEILGKDWVNNQLEEIKKVEKSQNKPSPYYVEQFNPLAFKISKAKEHIIICKKDSTRTPTEEIVYLSLLGNDVSELQAKKIGGLDEKVKLLMKENMTLDKINQIIYEISIANIFSSSGSNVEFLKESTVPNEKTPDLLVDGIEIECTKKDTKTKRDKINENQWETLDNKLNGIMDSAHVNYCMFIETEEDPSDDILKIISNKCKDLISKGQEGIFTETQFEVKLEKIFDYWKSIPSSLLFSDVKSFKTDEMLDEIRRLVTKKSKIRGLVDQIFDERDSSFISPKIRSEQGWAAFENLRVIGFSSKNTPDRIKSIENKLNQKRKQLSGSKSGVIILGLDVQTKQQIQKNSKRVQDIISSFFANNSKVSALVVTTDEYSTDEEKIMYSANAIVLRNPNAKFPLPKNFENFLDTNHDNKE